jgi:hypothetical protein
MFFLILSQRDSKEAGWSASQWRGRSGSGRTTSRKAARANSWPFTRRARIQPHLAFSLMPLPFLLPPLSTAPPPRARHGGRLQPPRPCARRTILRVRASGEAVPPPSRTQVSDPSPSPQPRLSRFSVPAANLYVL